MRSIGCDTIAEMELTPVDGALVKYPNPRDNLIALLQDIQDAYGYLSREALLHLSRQTGIAPATLHGVVTFYAQFQLSPPGRHKVLVCMGTACHVNGASAVADAVEAALGVAQGDTTRDGLFSWEKVACLGCCSLSPAMMIDGRAYGNLTADGVAAVIEAIRQSEGGDRP